MLHAKNRGGWTKYLSRDFEFSLGPIIRHTFRSAPGWEIRRILRSPFSGQFL